MYSSIRQGDKTTPYVVEFVVNEVSEIDEIPTDTIRPGSTCIVINGSLVYMLDNNKQWKIL